jgi:hypothetical protein
MNQVRRTGLTKKGILMYKGDEKKKQVIFMPKQIFSFI